MDKKARDIIGRPVISFSSGAKLYDVQDLIIDPERKQVLALVVEDRAFLHSARAIPFGRISAIGSDAVIVPDGKAVIDVDRDPVLKKLYNDQIIRGLRAVTDDGRKLGEVADMVIDDKTGEIRGFYVSPGRMLTVGQGLRWLPMDSVIRMGQRVMFVPAQVADEFETQTGGVSGALDQVGDKLRTAGAKANTQLTQLGDQVRETLPQRAAGVALGKTAHTTVKAKDGTVIVNEGDTITQDQVDAAKDAGRLPQLLMSAGAGPARQNAGALGTEASQSWEGMRTEARDLWNQLTQRYTQGVDEADDKIMQRRIRHALGRPASRVILDNEDNVILNTGDIITNRAVAAAREAGVLEILVDSVYAERPKLELQDLKAPSSGEASLEASQVSRGDAPQTTPGAHEQARSRRPQPR
jgi:uncharacterized protein YrrD